MNPEFKHVIKVIHAKYDEILREHPEISIPWYVKMESESPKPIVPDKSLDLLKIDLSSPVKTSSENKNRCEREGEFLNFLCPHCEYFTQVAISELNCRIFRHGFVVQKNEKGEVTALISQIGPHESEERCNELRNSPNISGCCMPFQIVDDGSGGFVVQKCGFI